MVQAVSNRFTNAQKADSNQVATKVQLVLGNYASPSVYGTTILATSTDASGNYPASGIIDGDRTEINVGPSAGADNNIGRSSWRSAGVPTALSSQNLVIGFHADRTVNRMKIYHLSGHGLKSYKLVDDRTGLTFAATSDIATGSQVVINTNGTLDIVDFPDITTNEIDVFIYGTQVPGDVANVVEIECYRVIDISDRIKGIRQTRQRDYKLVNPMAAAVQLDAINTDRYFSVSHVPTTAEAADGFVNQELRPGLGIIVQMGFNYYGDAPEMVTVFTGEIDSITISPLTRDASIQCRDLLKRLINNTADSSKLKTNIDISACIQYMLNRANVSNYEMSLDSTGINLPYFFTDSEGQLDVIRNLAQAAGDTTFYVSELGIPTFKDFSSNIPNQHVYTSEIDWEAGALANISTQGDFADLLAIPPQFIPVLADGAFSGNMLLTGGNLSLTTSAAYNGDSFSFGGGAMNTLGSGGSSGAVQVGQPFSIPRAGTINTVTLGGWQVVGTVTIQIWADSGGVPNASGVLYTSSGVSGNQSARTVSPGLHVSAGVYWLMLVSSSNKITKAQTALASPGHQAVGRPSTGASWFGMFIPPGGPTITPCGLASQFTFTYDTVAVSGSFVSDWYDSGSLAVNLTPVVNTTATYFSGNAETTYLDGSDDGSTVAVTYSTANLNGTHTFAIAQHRYWRMRVDASASDNVNVPVMGTLYLLFGATGTWTSPILDTGTSTNSYGSITDSRVLNGGTITYYTRSSSDGVSWNAYTAVSGSGLILSTILRYLQTQVVIGLGPGGVTPLILDITVGWTSGAGSQKYPSVASFIFKYNSDLFEVQQSLADNLGGDSSILNDVIVQAQPLVLSGTVSDTVWQGTIGTPPTPVSVTFPIAVTAGEVLTISPYVAGGMDISFMSGANPAAAVVTFAGGAAGSWVFSNIHPTLPVLTITITNAGNITDLRIVGETFQNASYLQAQEDSDATSIAQYGTRQLSISNSWISSAAAAGAIAAIQLANYKDPVAYIPSAKVALCPAIQLGDRVTISDVNLDLTGDYIVVGNNQTVMSSLQNATIETELILQAVPTGF